MIRVKKGILSQLLAYITLFVVVPVTANELVFTYWTDALEPFAIRSGDKLSGGIVKDIGDELAGRMELTPKYIELPTKRVEVQMMSGEAHIACLSNPKWEEHPANFAWSPVLFQGTDNFLVKNDGKEVINSIDDLEGKRVGTYNGYVYSEAITSLFDQGKAEPVRVNNLNAGMKLVDMGRLDTLIDFGSILEYEIKRLDMGDKLTVSAVLADSFDFHCAYSLKVPYDITELNKHLNMMKQEGFFETVLNKYR